MSQFGVTTIARWMAEQLPKGVEAYMENRGRLFRLKRISGYNGSIRPVLATLVDSNLGGEFTPYNGNHALNSAVFLSTGVDLAGVNVADIIDTVEPVCLDCWAMQAPLEGPARLPSNAALDREEVTTDAAVGANLPWYG
ncbi:MAG: hypothetical protein ACYSUB_02000 [Planctomycetota bacterium]|jgi:hypothetical protein